VITVKVTRYAYDIFCFRGRENSCLSIRGFRLHCGDPRAVLRGARGAAAPCEKSGPCGLPNSPK